MTILKHTTQLPQIQKDEGEVVELVIKPDGTTCSKEEVAFLTMVSRMMASMIIPDYELNS